MFKVDLHVHTALGGDSLIQPQELVPWARRAGLDAVCVTEHHSYELSRPYEEISRDTGFPIFRGMEYKAAEGHLLIFGVRLGRSDLMPGQPMQNALDWVHRRRGIAIPAHPFQRSMLGDCLGRRLFDLRGVIALEGINASASPEENRLALAAAADMGIACTGGSDAHGVQVIGRAWTRFETPIADEQHLVQALISGAYQAVDNTASAACGTQDDTKT